MYILPSPLDMASLAGCKSWLGITDNSNDANIQACLTAASVYFLRMTGRGPRNWQNTTQNPFNEPVTFMETYDGNSGNRLFLRNFPINSVTSFQIGGFAVAASTNQQGAGYAIDDQGQSLVVYGSGYGYSATGGVGGWGNLRGGLGSVRPFAAGVQRIQVQYVAGFKPIPIEDELYTILPGWQANKPVTAGYQISDGRFIQQAQNSGTTGMIEPPWSTMSSGVTPDNTTNPSLTVNWINMGILQKPYTITVQQDANVLSDDGVLYFSDGTALARVTIAPTEGQYFLVTPGVYLFNAADQGKQVLISYTLAGTPADIILAIFQLVGLNYMRRNWIGIRSIAMKDVGSTSYTMQLDQNIKDVLQFYRRPSTNS